MGTSGRHKARGPIFQHPPKSLTFFFKRPYEHSCPVVPLLWHNGKARCRGLQTAETGSTAKPGQKGVSAVHPF